MSTVQAPPAQKSRAQKSKTQKPPSRTLSAELRGRARDGDAEAVLGEAAGLGEAVERVQDGAQEAACQASPWIARLGRAGLATKGLVYLTIGVLATETAFGAGGETTDSRGALLHVVQVPFGVALLMLVALGLVGFALWRVTQALLDTERKGTDPKGLAERSGYLISAAVYGGLALFAVRLLMSGESGPTNDSAAHDWTAWLMAQPLGRWLVGGAGLGMIGTALIQFWLAWSTDFCKDLRVGQMSRTAQTWVIRLGRMGFAARGVAFGIIGGFLLQAAWHAQPQEARGLGGALASLAEQPFGPWLLAAVAFGLAAYGVYMLAEAKYRRVRVA